MFQLKHFFIIDIQFLDLLFFDCHELKSIKTFIIVLGFEFRLGHLCKTGSKMKQKILEFHQDYMKEARLYYLAMKIVK